MSNKAIIMPNMNILHPFTKQKKMKKLIPFSLFLSFLSLSLSLSLSTPICINTACNSYAPIIHFPFQLQTHQSPPSCSYPGFTLSCNTTTNQTLLELPYSGKFIVQRIDYVAQQILINDPNNCLAKRILSYSLSGSRFHGVYMQPFSFFNCSVDMSGYRLDPISCLSDPNFSVFATSSPRVFSFLSSMCGLIKTVSVPVEWPFYDQIWSSQLSDDLRLQWNEPRCGICEFRGGRCGFKNDSTHELACSNVPRGVSRSARYAIIVGAGIPSLLGILGLLLYLCSRVTYARERNAIADINFSVDPQATINMGLDGSILESYPKIVLGESLRLPKPDDNTCPVCLSEYRPKETLKSIPECQHCFHAECIDEWLSLKATCPICRTMPEKSPEASLPL